MRFKDKVVIVSGEGAATERQRTVRKLVPYGPFRHPRGGGRAVLFLASDEASYCNGSCLIVDGGLCCR